jgi:hypothetical protein
MSSKQIDIIFGARNEAKAGVEAALADVKRFGQETNRLAAEAQKAFLGQRDAEAQALLQSAKGAQAKQNYAQQELEGLKAIAAQAKITADARMQAAEASISAQRLMANNAAGWGAFGPGGPPAELNLAGLENGQTVGGDGGAGGGGGGAFGLRQMAKMMKGVSRMGMSAAFLAGTSGDQTLGKISMGMMGTAMAVDMAKAAAATFSTAVLTAAGVVAGAAVAFVGSIYAMKKVVDSLIEGSPGKLGEKPTPMSLARGIAVQGAKSPELVALEKELANNHANMAATQEKMKELLFFEDSPQGRATKAFAASLTREDAQIRAKIESQLAEDFGKRWAEEAAPVMADQKEILAGYADQEKGRQQGLAEIAAIQEDQASIIADYGREAENRRLKEMQASLKRVSDADVKRWGKEAAESEKERKKEEQSGIKDQNILEHQKLAGFESRFMVTGPGQVPDPAWATTNNKQNAEQIGLLKQAIQFLQALSQKPTFNIKMASL